MPVTEEQYRAYTKYRLKNKEKFNDYIRKNRELYPEKYLESQRKASIVYHAKKRGLTLDEYNQEQALKAVRNLLSKNNHSFFGAIKTKN